MLAGQAPHPHPLPVKQFPIIKRHPAEMGEAEISRYL